MCLPTHGTYTNSHKFELEMATLDDKTVRMAHSEDVESGRPSKDMTERKASLKHADRALAIVGDQRVELTDEDVSQC